MSKKNETVTQVKTVKLMDLVGQKAAGKDPNMQMSLIGKNLWASKVPGGFRLAAKLEIGYGVWKLEKYSGEQTITILSSGKWTIALCGKVIETGFWK